MFLQCVSTVIIVYIIISPLNSYLYIHWILDFKINIIIITCNCIVKIQTEIAICNPMSCSGDNYRELLDGKGTLNSNHAF